MYEFKERLGNSNRVSFGKFDETQRNVFTCYKCGKVGHTANRCRDWRRAERDNRTILASDVNKSSPADKNILIKN